MAATAARPRCAITGAWAPMTHRHDDLLHVSPDGGKLCHAGITNGARGNGMDYSPTVRGRRLIREIVRLRNDSGLSMDTAASRLDWRSRMRGP